MDAGVYARLSKRKRRRRDKESIEVQIAESRLYAGRKVWSIVLTESDNDISASKYTTKPRPGYEKLVEAVRRNEIEVIICTEVSRLYRRLEELLELIKMAEYTRLRGIWTTDDTGYDLSTPEGIHQAIGAVNNSMLESAKISVRQKRMKEEDAREGLPNGGGRPYGFEADQMTLRPDEVAVLTEAKDRYLSGQTMRDIVRDFYQRGVLSPYGKPWQIENFQRVLFSKRYLGIRVHNDAEYPAQWPAIFTQSEYDLMVARRDDRRRKYPGKGHGTGRQYLLTGLCYCGRCGTYMIGSRRKLPSGEFQRRYRCRSIDNHGLPLGCGKVFRGSDPLDAWITEAVLYRFDSPEVARMLSDDEPNHTEDLITSYQTAKLRLDQMVKDYAEGFLNRDEFAVAKRVAEDNLQRARDELSRYHRREARALLPARENIREVWENAGLDLRHSIIRLLVNKITVMPGSPGSMMWRQWRFDASLIVVDWRV